MKALAREIYNRVVPMGVKNVYRSFRKNLRDNRFDSASPATIPVIYDSLERTKDLVGDYYEFGLYKGFSFYKAIEFSQKLGLKGIKFFGFDSFEGLPEPTGVDSGWRFSKGNYAYSFEKVSKSLKKRIGDDIQYSLIKGFYSDSLSDLKLYEQYAMSKARVILIDCDLYSSTQEVLTFITPLLQDRTILIMDDWNCFDGDESKGQRLAMKEFLESHPEITLQQLGTFGWHGAYFQIALRA